MAVDPDDPDHWFVGSDTGVWYSEDGGATWLPLGTGFPNVVVYDLEIRRTTRKLVGITYGRGAWETDLPPPGSTGIETVAVAHHPHLMLDPPTPNPASDRTFLRFASRAAGRVTLDVYDVRGRLVENVADLSSADGIIRVVGWRTSDVPSGIYFVLLRSGSERLSRKIVVEK